MARGIYDSLVNILKNRTSIKGKLKIEEKEKINKIHDRI